MKKIYVYLLIIVFIIVIFISMKNYIFKKRIELNYIGSYQYFEKNSNYTNYFNSNDWVIISNKQQRKNWIESGYIIPKIDFNKNFIIISKYKIIKLYQKKYINRCSGVSDGIVIFNKRKSDSNFYYIYLMPKIMLTQGIG